MGLLHSLFSSYLHTIEHSVGVVGVFTVSVVGVGSFVGVFVGGVHVSVLCVVTKTFELCWVGAKSSMS